ncbi:MAG TPA: hypothetical protein VM681_06095 [Candidatus Thermoplasmatota archaeon]|nr:hypothetical protein [Candidatus Thermoplasmatota archaeon]
MGRLRAFVAMSVLVAIALAGCSAPSGAPPPGSSGDDSGSPGDRPGPTGGGGDGHGGNGNGASGNGSVPPPGQRPRFAGCYGAGPVRFTVSPMREEDFPSIIPYGLVVGAHVTPIDHMYFSPANGYGGERDVYEVRVIADGVIYSVQPRDVNVDTGAARQREWRMDIAHTCTFTSYFDLLTSLDPAIESEYNRTFGGRAGPWDGIPVRAGQVVGRIGGQTLDFGVYDYNVTLPGFVNVSAYAGYEPWKVHTVDPFPHFDEPVRSMLEGKNLRVAPPRAGKIDYDVDGRLSGNWFLSGTNGYAGLEQRRYWDGHLSLVYDHLDPTQLRFSIGNWTPGREGQFGVRGNAPDWGDVSDATGRLAIELVQFQHYAANDPSRMGEVRLRPGDVPRARNLESVQGVALMELLAPRLLKLEVFPGKTAAEVDGFTDAARIYER